MLHFHIITLFPETIEAYLSGSILGRARKKKLIKVSYYDPKKFAVNFNGTSTINMEMGGDFYGTIYAPNASVVDCTGAGDGSVSGFILSKYFGKDNLNSLRTAHTLSAEILQVNGAIATHLNQEKLLGLVTKYYPD